MIRKNATRITACTIALAVFSTTGLLAQPPGPPATPPDPGQQGQFEGDHQDTGAAANGDTGEPDSGKETPEARDTNSERLPEPGNAKPAAASAADTDRAEDARSDTTSH